MPAEITRDDIERLAVKLDLLTAQIARLQVLQETEAQRCPFRETISRAANNQALVAKNSESIERNRDAIQILKLNWAKLLGLMLGAGAAGGVIADGVAKLID